MSGRGPDISTPNLIPSEAWSRARSVLCVRLDQIGDVLMTGPAMRALGAWRRLTLLTSSAGAAVAELMPEVQETIVYEAPWVKAGALRGDPARDRAMVERLREGRFDAAVIFTVYSQSPLPAALFCRLAGVPLRLAHCRENPYGLLTDWVPEPEPGELQRHEVRRQLDLVAAVGAPLGDEDLHIAVPPGAARTVREKLTEAGLERAREWIAVHAGASAPSRRYPPELLARVCRALAVEHGVQAVFTGQAGERDLVEEVRELAGVPSVSLVGRLGLGELAALLQAAPLLLAGNSGPVHVAAAVGTPVVDIYALTNPQHTPWRVPGAVLFHDVPCRWCYKSVCPEGHHLCVRGVEPAEVVAAVVSVLRGRAPAMLGEPLRLA